MVEAAREQQLAHVAEEGATLHRGLESMVLEKQAAEADA